ncbi:MAG TPA: SBBP repeat-containing protein, partial [Spirochaetota bacterium]|nr:SBBP repeat-containing protein [Spirochaetota bacterium]
MKNTQSILRAAAIGLALIIAPAALFTSCWEDLDEVLGKRGKFELHGAYKWTKRIGASSQDEVQALAVDKLGNVYTSGFFAGTVNFRDDWGGVDEKTIV